MLPSNWQSLGFSLGISLNETGRYCSCPRCGKGTVLFADHRLTHKWYQCLECHSSGSLFDFISHLKQISVTAAREIVENQEKLSPETQKLAVKVAARTSLLNSAWTNLPTVGSAFVTAAMGVLLGRLKVQFLRQSWQTATMDNMLRAATGKQILAKLEGLPAAELSKLGLKQEQSYLVVRNYLMPGWLAGISIIGAGDRNSISVATVLTNTEESDPGFVIHPEVAGQNKPVVLTSSVGVWLKMLFLQLCGSPEHPTAVLAFEATRNHFIPRSRKSIVWTAELDATAVSMAKLFSNRVTRAGANNGSLSEAAEKRWPANGLFNFLAATTKPWLEQLKDQFERLSISEVISLITSIQMTDSEQDEIMPMLPPHIAEQLSARVESIPQSQAPVKEGLLTQTSEGWFLEKAGARRQITNMALRILRTVKGEHLQYQVQVYQMGQWESFIVPVKRLTDAPIKTLTDITAQAQLKPFQADPSISKCIIFYSEMLNPLHKERPEIDELGIDHLHGAIRTNRLRITVDPFSVESVSSVTDAKLLSYADTILPPAIDVAKILKSKLTTNTLNCLVMQTIRYMLGKTPIAITYGSETAPAVRHILSDMEVLGPHWPCDFTGIDLTKLTSQALTKLVAKTGIWTTLTEDLTYWLALNRPLMNLGQRPVRMADVGPRSLQRTYAQVLIRSVKLLSRNNVTPSQAMLMAWKTLGKDLKTELDIHSIIQPTSSEAAVAHWIRRGIEIGHLKRYGSKPKDMRGAVIIGRDNVQLLRDEVQAVIQKLKLPAVDIVTVVSKSIERGGAISCTMPTGKSILRLEVDPARVAPRGSSGSSGGSNVSLG